MCEMCLLICFPDSEWWTEWHCRVSVLRAAKWGHIPETQWHLLRCKMLLLFPFMALDLLFGGHKASNRSLTISRGRKKGEKAKRWQHMTILLNIPRNETLEGIWLYSFFKYCIYAKEGLTDAILKHYFYILPTHPSANNRNNHSSLFYCVSCTITSCVLFVKTWKKLGNNSHINEGAELKYWRGRIKKTSS